MTENDINSKTAALLALMRETESAQSELLGLVRGKRPAILNNNTEELNGIVTSEYSLLSLMKNIEKRRNSVIAEISKETGRPAGEITIGVVAEYTDSETAAALYAVRDELLKTAGLLKSENAVNKSLLETQLAYTGMMLGLFGGPEDPINNFYGADGKSADPEVKRNNIFDANI